MAKRKERCEIINLSEKETVVWLDKLKPPEDQYIKFLNEKGLPGADIIKTVKVLVDKANTDYPEMAPYVK